MPTRSRLRPSIESCSNHDDKPDRTLTDSEIEVLADEAEAGYDIDHLVARRNERGRPTLGAGPATDESVRLDPELKDQLLPRRAGSHVTAGRIREALRRYLQPS